MDDGLVLNLAPTTDDFSTKLQSKKGGRWTDRLKAKRNSKRKLIHEDQSSTSKESPDVQERPPKRVKTAVKTSSEDAAARPHTSASTSSSRPQAHVISSLFSSNPKIHVPVQKAIFSNTGKPSNAPLNDLSTFNGLGLDPLLSAHLIHKMKIERPTSIQRAALATIIPSLSNEETRTRDLFIQSQTGSGKTLAFLLPIIQDLLPLSKLSYINRSIGTLAIIIAPTRELAKQISDVLEALLMLRLRAENENVDDASSERFTRWMVSGLLIGGSTRAHEKAKLRKGVPILVATPGRLLDHLQKTAALDVGKCKWLVLDEADRLMELGFEESITGIIKGLDGRRNLAMAAVADGIGHDVGGWDWEQKRRIILCSATIREDVQKLAGATLTNPMMIKATEADILPAKQTSLTTAGGDNNFTPPSQLAQKYVIVPLKLRLVVLVALLRSLISQSTRASKIIVFMSCTDSVDFHFKILGGLKMLGDNDDSEEESSDDDEAKEPEIKKVHEIVQITSSLFPNTNIFRLHGSLPTHTRLAAVKQFSNPKSENSSILICTSVASRGLDLPQVRAVVQYDLPTEGGATEYVHRVGRTARAGKGGEAWAIIAPSELEWVKWVETNMQGDQVTKANVKLAQASVDGLLQSGFGGKGSEYEERATEVQLSFERWVLRNKDNGEIARKAFQSHMRAYSTHPSNEKHMFHIRHLHIGHLAKAFALRETPTTVSVTGSSNKKTKLTANKTGTKVKSTGNADNDAVNRMHDIVRSQGRLTKKGGVMMSTGASEFQIAGGYELEKMVNS